MLELVPPGVHIDFIGKAKIWMSISVVVILIGMASIVWRGGVNQGIDFSGGTLLQLRFSHPADLSIVREALGTLGLERSIVQHYGEAHEVLIRVLQGTGAGAYVWRHAGMNRRSMTMGGTVDVYGPCRASAEILRWVSLLAPPGC